MSICPGEKYGKLTVVDLVTDGNANKRKWLCKCECGGEKITSEDNLKRGHCKSCECPYNNEFVCADRDEFNENFEEWLYDQMCYEDNAGDGVEPSEEEYQIRLKEEMAKYEPYWKKSYSHLCEQLGGMTMADYMSREAAKQTLTALLIETALNNTGFKTDASKVYEDIAKNRLDTWLYLVPVAADVRPVVLCKDCRHRDPEDNKCDCGQLERAGCVFPVDDNYWCAHGEKGDANDTKD